MWSRRRVRGRHPIIACSATWEYRACASKAAVAVVDRDAGLVARGFDPRTRMEEGFKGRNCRL